MTGPEVARAADRYRELSTDLVAASRRHDAALAGANQSFADGVAAVEHDVAAAADSASAAALRAAQAQRAVAQTDLVAAGLWDELRRVRGRRGRRIGLVPPPMPSEDPEADSIALLDLVTARLERERRGGEPLPAMVLPFLLVMGSACAAAVGLAAVAVQRTGPIGLIIGWLLLAAAPAAGLPVARTWADYRFLARLDPGAIGLLVLGGMLATVAITVFVR